MKPSMISLGGSQPLVQVYKERKRERKEQGLLGVKGLGQVPYTYYLLTTS